MADGLIIGGLQYLCYALELGLLLLLLNRGYGRGLTALCFYVGGLFAVDSVVRPWFLHQYRLTSPQYFQAYWLTDALLTLGTFLLIYTFFLRTFSRDHETWAFIRPVLWLVLILVLALSCFAIKQHYAQPFTRFVYLFSQNLYFTGAVLNTVLYVMLQRRPESEPDLQLLVCGLGIQYAGSAATFALIRLTHNQNDTARLLAPYLAQVCTLAMLGTWFYAASRVFRTASRKLVSRPSVPVPV
ncbi:MAG TPA: hypothetical protein VI455_11970 [Terriglobia bacterium]